MGTISAKAMLLLLLVALPCIAFPQSPYSDAAFRTFISVSVDGSTVLAKVTFLNITYFSQVNGSALANVYRKANASRDLGDLYGIGNFSTENFTAEVVPAASISLRFTFEGNNVTDSGGGNICDPVETDEKGIAECEILYFKDASGQTRSIEEYKSCGYVVVRSDEKKLDGGRLQAASQTAVVCPENNLALSAFGPAIASEVGSNLTVCFPAMLILGLLIAAMYYSGRDPLSLFDITTPKLPKTQSFKVKMGTSPQMLRQVQRRYLMIKGQARRDAVREVARMAKAAGRSKEEISEAKKKMGRFYDELESMVKKGLKGNDELEMRQKWARIMEEYSKGLGGRALDGKRLDRSLEFSSGLLEAYIKAHQARETMNAARGKVSKSWWSRNVSSKVVDKLTDASIAFETSKTGRVLGRIPLVKHVVSTPTKILDVAVQLRGSRQSLKAIRGELIGQAATMLGQTKLGAPLYRAARALHVTKGGNETWFAKAYGRVTGRSFKEFEEKHDISKKRLVEYYKTTDSIRQNVIDAHNRLFDELAAKLIESMPLRANAANKIAQELSKKGMSKEAIEGLMRINSLDELFGRMKSGLVKTEEGRKIEKDISAMLAKDASALTQSDVNRLIAKVQGATLSADEKKNLETLLKNVRASIAAENKLQDVLNDLHREATQAGMLKRLAEAAGSGHLDGAIRDFDAAEKILRDNLIVFLDRDIKSRSLNYYRIIDKDQLKSDIAEGMSRDKLEKKYGREMLARLVEDHGAFERAVNDKNVEARVFAKFAAEEEKMKKWILDGNADRHLDRYVGIAGLLGNSAFGRNPLGDAITAALKKLGISDAFLYDNKGEQVFSSMDALEQFLKPKSGGGGYGPEFEGELKRLSALKKSEKPITPEEVLRAVMPSVLDFARDWSARQYATGEIMHGGANAAKYMASFRAALKDVENFGKVKDNLGYLGGEKAFYRWEMGYNDYRGVDTEALVFTARGWEKLFGFVVADRWAGISRGEQVLHQMNAAREDYASTLARYKALYLNLISKESVFYSDKFESAMLGAKGIMKNIDEREKRRLLEAFDVAAYDAIIKRGYTWQDKKNGLELLLSVDRKSTPMLEFEKKYMKPGEDMIVKKAEYNGGRADIRDYAPLVARTMGSYYSTREAGFIVLIKQGDKWIYGDPFKAEGARDKHSGAEKQVTMRADMMKEMVRISDSMKIGDYDPTKANIRVISIKDFVTYAKDPAYSGKNNVFGDLGKLDRMREGLRASTLYKPSMLAAELFYGAYSDRMDRMNQWYAGQWQVRQALDRLQHTMQDTRIRDGESAKGMYQGKERFKYSGDYVNSHYADADSGVREAIGNEMNKLARGQTDSSLENARAWYNEWHGRIASRVVGEIGAAETDFHNAKLEVRALERLAAHDKSYLGLYNEALARKDGMRSEYKHAKEEYTSFNRDVIGWVGSHGGMTYAPQRTMWTLGLAGRLLDSHFVQGTQDAFYNITESSVMRDPRVAIGATNPGWEYSYYVGYHTGQNVYERARFWATNSLWEQQMRFQTDLAYTVHKWWNDKISFFGRYTSGYPAPVQSDMIYAPQYHDRKWGSYLKTLLVTVPLQGRTYTDYFRARWQDAITFTGAGAAMAAYQSLGGGAGPGDGSRSWLRNRLDKKGRESPHYFETPFRIASQQRYVDQVMAFDDFVNKRGSEIRVNAEGESMSLNEARDRLKQAAAEMDYGKEDEYKKAISDTIGKYVRLDDRRGRFVRDVFSGSDIQEDGSRNRFLDMYAVFHSNVFTPTIPGMLHAAPLGNSEWHTFPQVARNIENAAPGSRLYPTKHYWEASYDREEGRISFADRFSTREDAVAEAYRNDMPVLMHLMKMQQKDIHYSPINTPSLTFASPIWFGIGRKIYKTVVNAPGLESLQSTVEPQGAKEWANFASLGMYGAYDNYRQKKAHPEQFAKEDEYEIRRRIYGQAGWLADEAEKTREYLESANFATRWLAKKIERDYEKKPGLDKISRKTEEEYYAAMLKRSG